MPEFRIDHKILLAALKHPAAGMRHPDVDRADLKMHGKIRPPAGWVPADGADIEWARERGLPAELIKVFDDGWPSASTEIGPWARIRDLASIREEAEANPTFLEQGFLIIGRALNGDPIAVDLRGHPGAIGFFCPDNIIVNAIGRGKDIRFEYSNNLRAEFFEVSPSLGAFALGVVKDALPIDSWATWSDENEKASWFDDVDVDNPE